MNSLIPPKYAPGSHHIIGHFQWMEHEISWATSKMLVHFFTANMNPARVFD